MNADDVADLDVDGLAEFRDASRSWLSANAPAGLADLVDWYEGFTLPAGSNRATQGDAQKSIEYRAWETTLLEHGLVCPHWPIAVGGRGWNDAKYAVFAAEAYRAGLPLIDRGFSANLVGRAILDHGSLEQQKHFLSRIITGEDRYCQGFSEPNHGSDLAAVETRAVIEGDEIVITGQKTWTSQFDRANMMFLLCRTSDHGRPHEGLTFVVIPFLSSNGIDVRPIKQITGASDFAEEFIDGARAPMANIIGGINNGWAVAQSTLAQERVSDALVVHLGFEREFHRLLEHARTNGALQDPLVRQRLATAFTRTQILKLEALETIQRTDAGLDIGTFPLTAKLFWSEYQKFFGELALDVGGPLAVLRPESVGSRESYELDMWQDIFLCGRGASIFSGTNEIQRTIIAERLLGLPREPRAT
ncbi:MAG: putative acyl-CoA dehydrogenase [Frankiales bacterium]|nr:putative acyl-CoA dehydrogenase [Frankiales bacterium]